MDRSGAGIRRTLNNTIPLFRAETATIAPTAIAMILARLDISGIASILNRAMSSTGSASRMTAFSMVSSQYRGCPSSLMATAWN
jgi:hypothetical protein